MRQSSPAAEPSAELLPYSDSFRFVDLKAQYETIREQITDAVLRTLESQQFIYGPEVQAFETEIAAWNSSRFATGCASGSDALLLALMALGIGSGDEVITTPFTFVATVGAIVRLGARPVFVDVQPDTFNIDTSQIDRSITAKTRAIIPVHLFGLPTDLDPISEICQARGIALVEDAAQALGARYRGKLVGNIGVLGCFSFFPAKNLGAGGDGGLVTTNDAQLAHRLTLLHEHGSPARYYYELVGVNSRLDALQAAILRVKLPHVNRWTEARRANAERYRRMFNERNLEGFITLPFVPDYADHVYYQFTIRCRRRDELRAYLKSLGMPSEVYYPLPLHLQKAFANLGYREGDFPESEGASREVLSLPIYPELPIQKQEAVVDAIARFYGK
jgi:dTDP-4-amino-4,6-dideoxygalactose transaminase